MAGTSALLKNAANIRDQLATYQDSLLSYEYSNSAYTDSALGTYSDYLTKRIESLQASGSISGASKALSLTKSLDSATKQNISATIQRENIQMMSGNATLSDKYNVIVGQYMRAQANGDLTLAQSLMSQAYSVSQSIQLQAQQSSDAAVTLAKAAAAAEAANAGSLKQSLQQLNNDIKLTGAKDFEKTVKAWTDTNSATLTALGVKLPNQPNYFDVVHGVAGAIINHDSLAAKMYAPNDPGRASDLATSAYNLANGIDSLPTLGGNLTVPQVLQAAANPNQYVYNPSEGKFLQTQVIGHQMAQQYDINGNPTGFALQPVFSGQLGDTVFKTPGIAARTGLPMQAGVDTGVHTAVLNPTQTALINTLKLKFDTTDTKSIGQNGIPVSATVDSPTWVKNVLGDNGATNLFSTPQGLQFTYNSKNGTGLSSYTIVADNTGKLGIAEESNTGTYMLNGEYGFNPSSISNTSSGKGSVFDRLGRTISSGAGSLADTLLGGFMGHASAMGLLNQATSNYQLPPIPIAPPMQLPPLSVAPPTPTAPLHVTPTSAPITRSVSPQVAASPQPTTFNPQGGTFNPQSGAANPQGGLSVGNATTSGTLRVR